MSGDLADLRTANGVATLVLDDQDRRNAPSREVVAELDDALDDAPDEIERRDVRRLEVRGAGDVFSAVGDVETMIARFEGDVALHREVRELLRTTSRLIARIVTFPLPTVARITGPAVGAGATLAIGCDVGLAREDARIAFGSARGGRRSVPRRSRTSIFRTMTPSAPEHRSEATLRPLAHAIDEL